MRILEFSPREKRLIDSKDLCRLATIDSSGWPHNVPVSYLYDRGLFYIPANKNSAKVLNIRELPKATILIDDDEAEAGVMATCGAKMLRSRDAERWKRFMREVKHWQNDEDTIVIMLRPLRKTSWFLKRNQTQ